MKVSNKEEYVEIDLMRLFTALWHKIWIVVISMIACLAMTLGYVSIFVKNVYQANIQVYVINNTLSVGSTSVSLADLTASKSLVDTYIVILRSRKTLNEVIKQGNLDMTYSELNRSIGAAAINGTEVFRITVNNRDPGMAEKIANTIADVLPDMIENVMGKEDLDLVRVVDNADNTAKKVAPNKTKYAVMGLLIGLIVSAAVIILRELFDEQIRDEETLRQAYDLPILAVIPSLDTDGKKTHGKGYYYGSYYGSASKNRRTGR